MDRVLKDNINYIIPKMIGDIIEVEKGELEVGKLEVYVDLMEESTAGKGLEEPVKYVKATVQDLNSATRAVRNTPSAKNLQNLKYTLRYFIDSKIQEEEQ